MDNQKDIYLKQIKRYKKILEELDEIEQIIDFQIKKNKVDNIILAKMLSDIEEYHYTITNNCI